MTTIREVAREAGVSIGTVSNVVTGAVPVSPGRRERVLAAIRKLRYHPNHVARSLKLRRTKMLGMVVSDITNPTFSQMVRGAEDAALERNYMLLTFNTDDRVAREIQVLSVLRSRRVDGILLVVAPSAARPSHIRETLKAGTPIVCLDRVPSGIRVDSVSVDNAAAAGDCVRHLLALGHRKIGIITGPLAIQTAQERLRGYKVALTEADIPIRADWIKEGDFHMEGGYRKGREFLMASNRPTALFVSNSLMAIGVLKALGELGLGCPRDIALATFDDLPLMEGMKPNLTAVAQPAYSMGYKGAEILIQKIESPQGRTRSEHIRFPTELKIRESTFEHEVHSHLRQSSSKTSHRSAFDRQKRHP